VTSGTPTVASPPALKSLYLSYSAQDSIVLDTTQANLAANFAARTSYYYHLEPFGFRDMQPAITSDPITFLPVFDLDDGVAIDDGGELINNAQANETFSILFQVSDGSANH
jgi:hypothetical protein